MHETLQNRWSEIGDKLIQMAREFPEDQYEVRPAAGARTFAEQLRHVAFWNEYVGQKLQRANPDGSANEIPREAAPTKARVLDVLERSFSCVRERLDGLEVDDAAADTMVSFIEHNGEHYGQLAVYYRLHGLVPPASR